MRFFLKVWGIVEKEDVIEEDVIRSDSVSEGKRDK